jgi:18S rRNA (adenine1779-N6/adenine1780-N6)-dimethyltransferase
MCVLLLEIGLYILGPCWRPPAGDDGGSSDDDMADGEEGEEGGQQAGNGGGGSARRRRGKATEGFKEQVVEVLQRHDFLERRAAKMSQDDFLHLLAVFNQAGIHFV